MHHIMVRNPNHVCKGVKSITVNGKAVSGNVLPATGGGDEAEVEVLMG